MKKIYILLSAVLLASACQQGATDPINVIPYPDEVEVKGGTFNAAGAAFSYAPEFDQAAKDAINSFASQMSLASGVESLASEGNASKGFVFRYNAELPKEAYTLAVSRKAAIAEASSLNGVIYAIQTMKQMLPTEVFGKTAVPEADWTMPCATINDAPRFGYRGLHLDEARHFFGMDAVKRYIDIMEVHKLNTLHWHLTDDQGWRIEIKKYPKLTEVGSIRKKTIIGHIHTSKDYDHTPYGEGMWYSQDQIREVIAYAAAKGITIIPEIDLPGHMLAALTAYPELGCTGGPYDVWGDWGISENVLCVGKENTMSFLEDVLAEVCELFPAEYVHIGGDECPKVRWEKCPHCQAKIKELGLKDDDKHKAEHYLQSYVTARMEKFLATKGKKLIGWDEILEGEVAPNATIMSWRGVAGGLEAVRLGHDAIMTPNTYYYLDYYQTIDKENEPLAIGGYLPIEKCYSYEPTTEEMTAEEIAHILGVQANMWTEYIGAEDHLQYMLLPRLAALSEVQWCSKENKNWERFHESLDEICAIYGTMGYNYATHVFDAKGEVCVNNGTVEVKLHAQGDAPIRYTLDGSEPDGNSALYEGPVAIEGTCTLKAKTDRPGMNTRTFVKNFTGHKAMGSKVVGNCKPHKKYTFNYPENLTDGIRGLNNFNSGEWTGVAGEPFDVVVEMDGSRYSSVTVGTLVAKPDWIFNPVSISISVSKNDMDYQTVAQETYPVDGPDAPNGIRDYRINIPETDSKYIRVKVQPVEALPEWHGGKGRRGYIFIDEITVE